MVESFFNTITPEGIIIHHTVLIPEGDLPETEPALDRFHDARGFEVACFGKIYHIAYHYLILPDGQVVSGRPERCEGAYARGYNSYLGIALMGNFSSKNRARGSAPVPNQNSKTPKSFIWCRLGTRKLFFLSLSCPEVVPAFR